MSACIGSEAAGARTMTATSSNGLALMWEMLYIASASRLPIILNAVNRALSGPLNIHNDHSDTMGARDAGWIQLYGETSQEAYDNMIMGQRIAEHEDVMLPLMNCYDGFITSHAVENLELIEDEKVKAFVGEYKPKHYLLNRDEKIAMGPLDLPPYYTEHKYQQHQAMINAKKVILDVADEFEKLTGRKYGLFEEYMMDDAEIAIVIMSSSAGTAKFVVNQLREKGVKAGLVKIRVFRPFPVEEIAEALSKCKAIAIMDKAASYNAAGGPVYSEVVSALYAAGANVPAVNYIYGLGGRDVKTTDIEEVYTTLAEIAKTGEVKERFNWLALRD